MTDLRFAFRQLLKSPGFTLLAVLTLAVGIGLNTAIFTLINDLFLRRLPFEEPARLVHMFANRKEANLTEIAISVPRFKHYRDGQTIFSSFAADNGTPFTLTGVGDPVLVNGGRVTSNYFDTLGVRPIRGRTFLPNEEETADVAVVTEACWRKRLGGDPNIIGRSITLDGVAHTIVGVLPNQPAAWFGNNPVAEVWTTKPFILPGLSQERIDRGSGFLRVIGRPKSGVTIEQVRAALPSLDQSYATQYPDKVDSHGFTIALSILTGMVMGFYPAWQSSRADLVDALKEGGRGTSGSLRQQRFRRILVGAQVALSVTLLAGAALLIASFVRLSQQNIGFNPHNLWVGFATLPTGQYPDIGSRYRFADQTLKALQAVPGFENVSLSSDIPLASGSRVLYTRPEGDVPPIDKRPAAPNHEIMPGFFKTWGIPLLSGRDIDAHDVEGHQNVILISQAGAHKLYGNENPIGHTLLITGGNIPAEIVGVVGDVRSQRLAEAVDMELYRPTAQENFPFLTITVRSSFKPEAVTKLVQSALVGIDPAIAIAQPQPMDTIVAQALGQARLMMMLLGIFAGVALLLATVGFYGAVAYTVAQRTGEIGVRMALGAQTADVLAMVVRQGMMPVIIGLGVGVGSTLVLGRLLSTQLYQVSPHNPMLLASTALLLALV